MLTRAFFHSAFLTIESEWIKARVWQVLTEEQILELIEDFGAVFGNKELEMEEDLLGGVPGLEM